MVLIFEHFGINPYNRTPEEYEEIARQLPPLKVLHGIVNDRLQAYGERSSITALGRNLSF